MKDWIKEKITQGFAEGWFYRNTPHAPATPYMFGLWVNADITEDELSELIDCVEDAVQDKLGPDSLYRMFERA